MLEITLRRHIFYNSSPFSLHSSPAIMEIPQIPAV